MTDELTISDDQVAQAQKCYAKRLHESTLGFYSDLGLVDPRNFQLDFDYSGVFRSGRAAPYFQRSQGRGEVLPVYTTWQDLEYIRQRSRRLCAENEFAISAIENRRNYVVGNGLTYRAVPRSHECPQGLCEKVQRVIDVFVEYNDLPNLEADTLKSADEDGEAFLRSFPQSSGLLVIRKVEAEHVIDPHGDVYTPQRSFGVETDHRDIENVHGYWIVEDPYQNNTNSSFVGVEEVTHIKFNTSRSAKRGLPTFYPVEQNLRRAEDLLASMASMAKTRAKIALIRKFNDILKGSAKSMLEELKEVRVTDPTTKVVLDIERLRYGSVLNSSGGVEYEFPPGNVNAGDYVAVLQAELRAVAARLVMPEWMLTVDASSTNYASSLVAEAPSVKMFERLQRVMIQAFGKGRFRGRESLIWKQLNWAIEVGLLPREIKFLIDIQVDAPTLVVRDKAQEATTNQIYNQMGVKSVGTVQDELGLDRDEERENLAHERQQGIGLTGQSQLPGQPGSEVSSLQPPGIKTQLVRG